MIGVLTVGKLNVGIGVVEVEIEIIQEIKIYNKNNILMMFKLALFDDFDSILLSSLCSLKINTHYHNHQKNYLDKVFKFRGRSLKAMLSLP